MADETTSIALPRKIRFLLISFIFVIFAVTVLTLNYHPVDPVPRNPTPFLKSCKFMDTELPQSREAIVWLRETIERILHEEPV